MLLLWSLHSSVSDSDHTPSDSDPVPPQLNSCNSRAAGVPQRCSCGDVLRVSVCECLVPGRQHQPCDCPSDPCVRPRTHPTRAGFYLLSASNYGSQKKFALGGPGTSLCRYSIRHKPKPQESRSLWSRKSWNQRQAGMLRAALRLPGAGVLGHRAAVPRIRRRVCVRGFRK